MKLSFVIPAHNEQDYLPYCLNSIIQETRGLNHEIEIIVVNNASTDATEAVILSYPQVKLVTETRPGISFARQAGYLAATGDLIISLDSDSILTPNWLATTLKRFTKRPKLIALSGPFIYYDLPLGHNLLVRVFYYLGFASYLLNRFILRSSSMLQGGNIAVRRSALEAINGYNLAIDFYGEDTDLARRLNKLGPVVWTFDLPIYSSGRRLKVEGLWQMAIKYPINYVWTIFFKKPFHQTHTNIRTKLLQPGLIITDQNKLQKFFQRGQMALGLTVLILVLSSFLVFDYLATSPALAQTQPTSSIMKKLRPWILTAQTKIKTWANDNDDR